MTDITTEVIHVAVIDIYVYFIQREQGMKG